MIPRHILSAEKVEEDLITLYKNTNSAVAIVSIQDVQIIELYIQYIKQTLEMCKLRISVKKIEKYDTTKTLDFIKKFFGKAFPTHPDLTANYILEITLRLSALLLELTQQKKHLEDLNEKKQSLQNMIEGEPGLYEGLEDAEQKHGEGEIRKTELQIAKDELLQKNIKLCKEIERLVYINIDMAKQITQLQSQCGEQTLKNSTLEAKNAEQERKLQEQTAIIESLKAAPIKPEEKPKPGLFSFRKG